MTSAAMERIKTVSCGPLVSMGMPMHNMRATTVIPVASILPALAGFEHAYRLGAISNAQQPGRAGLRAIYSKACPIVGGQHRVDYQKTPPESNRR